MLKIIIEDTFQIECASVILVPQKAIEEAGYIQTFTDGHDAAAKHEFHAMAQMAYFQYQDDELEVETVTQTLRIESDERVERLGSGLVLYRDTSGGLGAMVHEGLNRKKLFEAANRFCTRWVRLDI